MDGMAASNARSSGMLAHATSPARTSLSPAPRSATALTTNIYMAQLVKPVPLRAITSLTDTTHGTDSRQLEVGVDAFSQAGLPARLRQP